MNFAKIIHSYTTMETLPLPLVGGVYFGKFFSLQVGGGIDLGGTILTHSNNWEDNLVIMQDIQGVSEVLVGKAGIFSAHLKYCHVLSHVSNRFRYIK